MTNLKLKMVAMLVVWPLCLALGQQTWYVSPAGDDGYSGTSWTQAFRTIAKGVTEAQAGHVVLLSNGVYLADGAGTPGSGAAAGDSMVHIAAGITVRGWTDDPADVILNGGYSNGAPGAVTNRLVYMDHPDAILAGVTITNGFAVSNGGGIFLGEGIVSNCVIAGNIASNHGGAIYVSSLSSTVTHCRVQGNISSCRDNTYYNGAAIYLHDGGHIFTSEILDNTNTYRGIGGVTLRGRGVVRDCVFSNNGGPYAAALTLNFLTGPVLVDDCEFSGHVSASRTVFVQGAEHSVTFTNCRIYANNLLGLSLNARDALVTDCLFSNNVGGGLIVETDPKEFGHSNTIANSVFIGNSGVRGGGILLQGRDNIVTGCWFLANSAQDGGAVASYYQLATNNLITHSTIISNTASRRGGGVYLLGANGADTVQYSYIAHNSAGTEGGGIRAAGYAGGLLRNNLIVSNSANLGGGVYVLDGRITNEFCTIGFNYATNRGGGMELGGGNNRVVNCIVVSNTSGLSAPEIHLHQATETNAFWHSCTPGITNPAQHNINADPNWVAPATGNFRLASGSPCIDAGTNLSWAIEQGAVDLDGRPRLDRFMRQTDMGCYEYILQGTLFRVW